MFLWLRASAGTSGSSSLVHVTVEVTLEFYPGINSNTHLYLGMPFTFRDNSDCDPVLDRPGLGWANALFSQRALCLL